MCLLVFLEAPVYLLAIHGSSGRKYYLDVKRLPPISIRASFALLDAENTYKKRMQDMIHERLHTLWESTGLLWQGKTGRMIQGYLTAIGYHTINKADILGM